MTKQQAINQLNELKKVNTFGMDMYELADINSHIFDLECFIANN